MSRWDKNPNVLNKNSLLIIRCRARLGSLLSTYRVMRPFCNYCIVQSESKTNPKNFCKSHLTSVCAAQKVFEFLWQQEIRVGERRDGKNLKGERHERETHRMKESQQNKWISRVPRSPECESGVLIRRQCWSGLCEGVKNWKWNGEEQNDRFWVIDPFNWKSYICKHVPF